MVAKPYSSSHIAAVSSHFTTMRLSGDVKDRLVTLLCEELDRLVPRMEDETLTQDPERKTLDDPRRSRLNFSRTRNLMIDRITRVDSVGSAAVQAGVIHLEVYLERLLDDASNAAERDGVATIKPRHLDRALHNLNKDKVDQIGNEVTVKDSSEDIVVSQMGGILTQSSLLSLAKSISKMAVTKEALDELLVLYSDRLDELESSIHEHAQLGSNPSHFIEAINEMRGMMTLGWMRSKLKRSATLARDRGQKAITLQEVVDSQSYAAE